MRVKNKIHNLFKNSEKKIYKRFFSQDNLVWFVNQSKKIGYIIFIYNKRKQTNYKCIKNKLTFVCFFYI